MHPATLRGVGVITKLYFATFAVFKVSMTLNLAQRSFKVIDFGTNQKRVIAELQRIRSRYLNVRDRQTDGQTDNLSSVLAISLASRGKNITSAWRM